MKWNAFLRHRLASSALFVFVFGAWFVGALAVESHEVSSDELMGALGAVCEDCKVNPVACIADTCLETTPGSGVWVRKVGTLARHSYSFEVGAGKPGLNLPAKVENPKDCIKTSTCQSGAKGKAKDCSDCGPDSVEQVTTKCTPLGKYCQN